MLSTSFLCALAASYQCLENLWFAQVLKEKVIEVIILLLDYLTVNETCSGNNK